MAKATLDQIVEEIKTLAPDERRQLREMLDAMMMSAEVEDNRGIETVQFFLGH